MEEIGNLFLLTREAAGISLAEVSEDLDIEKVVLENIEDGKTGAFSDVFVLKNYISEYAKYLGLDSEKIVDEFNEFVFESTSKIPIKAIEKQISESKKEDNSDKVFSPYTHHKSREKSAIFYVVLYTLIILIVIFAVFWSVKEITVGSISASVINYGK